MEKMKVVEQQRHLSFCEDDAFVYRRGLYMCPGNKNSPVGLCSCDHYFFLCTKIITMYIFF